MPEKRTSVQVHDYVGKRIAQETLLNKSYYPWYTGVFVHGMILSIGYLLCLIILELCTQANGKKSILFDMNPISVQSTCSENKDEEQANG